MILDVYVDGSYTKRTPNITTGGVVIVKDSESAYKAEVILIRHVVTEYPNFVSMNNAGGEVVAAIVGVIDACQLCKGEKSIVNIYYDYKGIRDFITGGYTARAEGNKEYVYAIQSVLRDNPNVEIKFFKVTAHTGDKYNDLADSVSRNVVPRQYESVLKETITI